MEALTAAQFWTRSTRQENPYAIPITPAVPSDANRNFSAASETEKPGASLDFTLRVTAFCRGEDGTGSHSTDARCERELQTPAAESNPCGLLIVPTESPCIAIVFIFSI